MRSPITPILIIIIIAVLFVPVDDRKTESIFQSMDSNPIMDNNMQIHPPNYKHIWEDLRINEVYITEINKNTFKYIQYKKNIVENGYFILQDEIDFNGDKNSVDFIKKRVILNKPSIVIFCLQCKLLFSIYSDESYKDIKNSKK